MLSDLQLFLWSCICSCVWPSLSWPCLNATCSDLGLSLDSAQPFDFLPASVLLTSACIFTILCLPPMPVSGHLLLTWLAWPCIQLSLCSAYCPVPAGPPPANGCQPLLNLYPASYQLSNCLTAVCQIQGLLLPPAILAIWSISDKAPAMLLTSMIGWTPYKHLYLLVLLQPLEPGL